MTRPIRLRAVAGAALALGVVASASLVAAAGPASAAAVKGAPRTTTTLTVSDTGTAYTPITVRATVKAADKSVPRGAVRFTLVAANTTFTATVGLKKGTYTFTSDKARAGTFSLTAKYLSVQNSKKKNLWRDSTSATKTITLAKAPVTITPADQTMTSGGTEPKYTYTVSGGQPFSSDPKYLPVVCGVAGTHTTPGIYQITCVYSDPTQSFDVTTNTATLTVLPAV